MRLQNGKRVVAEARHQVIGPGGIAQQVGELHEQAIAGGMADGMVDQPEMVEIDVKQAARWSPLLGGGDGGLDRAGKMRPVGELRQGVARREIGEPLAFLA